MSEGGAKSCFKYGCIGCVVLVAMVVGLIFLLGAVQMTVDVGDPRPETTEVAHELPDASGDVPGALEVPPLPRGLDPGSGAAAPGRVILDVSMAELRISPGPAGEPIRLVADYDANSYRLEEELTTADDGGWAYELKFRARRGFLGMLLGEGQNPHNRLELILPRDHLFDLEGKIGIGETEADLGGLWLRDVDLELKTGEHFFEVREPLREPMGSFELASSVGSVEVRSLGNASPRTVAARHSVGELLLDLDGPWRNDAEVELQLSIGEGKVWLPEGVRVEVERASVSIGEKDIRDLPRDEDLPPGAPTLRLDLRGSIGEISIRR